MSSDEDDYMSSVYVTAPPGLGHGRQLKRAHQTETNPSSKRSPAPKLEAVVRSAGLGKRIEETNKGFAMMSKMGYNPGAGLGSAGQGRTEPVEVFVKEGRKGLGEKTAAEEMRIKWEAVRQRRQKEVELAVDSFRSSLSEKAQQRQVAHDLGRSQKACYTLDRDSSRAEPTVHWFWPEVVKAVTGDEEDDDRDDCEAETLSNEDKLSALTAYLRQVHYYCIWCGVEYRDLEDLQGCPGSTRQLHDDL